jgi:hypothetical protein
MSERSYSLAEVSEILHISPDTIYKWESHMPQIKPERSDGGRRYNEWELELLKHTKRFFFTYNQEIPMTKIAVERWVSRNKRPESAEGERKRDTDSAVPKQRVIGKSPNDLLSPLRDEGTPSGGTPAVIAPSMSHGTGSGGYSSYQRTEYLSSNSSAGVSSTSTRSLTGDNIPMSEVVGDHSEVQTWKRAFNQTQAELTQTKSELVRARESLQNQHAAIKQIQADFNGLKELIRKEIYDLRDLIIDKP